MILILSGYDPTGNAGILRDIDVCRFFKKKFSPIVTALAFQTNEQYLGTSIPHPNYFQDRLCQMNFKKIKSVKIGMLGNKMVVEFAIAALQRIKEHSPKARIVWDPVLESTSGGKLLSHDGKLLAQKKLIKFVDIVTPNIPEAEIMTNSKNHGRLCENFFKQYHKPIYLKGGHLKSKSIDFFYDGKNLRTLSSKTFEKSIRGTGCLFSTSLACHLAGAQSLWQASRNSKKFMESVFSGKTKI